MSKSEDAPEDFDTAEDAAKVAARLHKALRKEMAKRGIGPGELARPRAAKHETGPAEQAIVISDDPDDTALAPLDNDPMRYPHLAPEIPTGEAPGFSPARLQPIRHNGGTEDLLNGMIAECHFVMRRVTLPSAIGAADDSARRLYLTCAMELAKTGATIGKAIAKLRTSAQIPQERQPALIEALARVVHAEKA